MNLKRIGLAVVILGLSIIFVNQSMSEEGLTAHYSFDTDKANDDSGNNLHGTVIGGPPELINGVVGKAWNFNGSLKIEMDYPDFKAIRQELSMRCFIRPEETKGLHIIYEEGGAWNGYCVRIMGGNLEFGVVSGGENHPPHEFVSSELPKTGDWFDIGTVFDKGTISLYINGKKADEKKTGWTQIDAHGQAVGIGEKQSGDTAFGAASGFYIGDMDELKVYSRALQPQELASAVLSINKLATTWGELKGNI